MERNLKELHKKLSERLSQPLPGEKAQMELSPIKRPMASGLKDIVGLRKGAVLIAFYPWSGSIHTIFIERTEFKGAPHSGQIGFPGGKKEQGDKNLFHTALREAEEEVNIPSHKVEIAGAMTEVFIPVSSFVVKPVLGILKDRPLFIPEEKEVQSILEVPLDDLLSNENISSEKVNLNMGGRIEVPCLKIKGKVIWGATAMMVGELRAVMKDVLDV